MIPDIIRRFTAALYVLSLPGTIAHELTHYLVARSITADASMFISIFEADAHVVWDAPESTHPVHQTLGFLAPSIVGISVAIGLLAQGLFATITSSTLGFLLLIFWAQYTIPSPADLNGALNALNMIQHNTSTHTEVQHDK